jgi:hypothetical protein
MATGQTSNCSARCASGEPFEKSLGKMADDYRSLRSDELEDEQSDIFGRRSFRAEIRRWNCCGVRCCRGSPPGDSDLDSARPSCCAAFLPSCGSIAIVAGVLLGASERLFFKVLVGTVERYRYFVAIVLLVVFALAAATAGMLRGRCNACQAGRGAATTVEDNDPFPSVSHSTNLALWKLVVMAMLDNAQLFMLIIAAGLVPAPMTVTLLQASIPVGLATRLCLCHGGNASAEMGGGMCLCVSEGIGAVAIVAGILIHLSGYWLQCTRGRTLDPEARLELWCCLVYTAAALPAALSDAFKRRVLRRQCVDMFALNVRVALAQAILAVALGCVLLPLQWLYLPASFSPEIADAREGFSANFEGGFDCLFTSDPVGHASFEGDFAESSEGGLFSALSRRSPGFADCRTAGGLAALVIYVVATLGFNFLLPALAALSVRGDDLWSGGTGGDSARAAHGCCRGERAVRFTSVAATALSLAVLLVLPATEWKGLPSGWKAIVGPVFVVFGAAMFHLGPRGSRSAVYTSPAFRDTDANPVVVRERRRAQEAASRRARAGQNRGVRRNG